MLAYYFFQPESAKKAGREGIVRKGFTRLLALGLRHRILTIVAAFGTLGIALFLVLNLGMQFFPAASKPIIYLNLKGETMSLAKTAELTAIAEDILKEEPLVDHYTTAVGKGLPSFFLTVPTVTAADNVSQIMMQLNEEELKKYSDISDAARHIQALMDGAIAGADAEVKCLEYSIPTDARIVLNVTGIDMDKINGAAGSLMAALEQIPGTENVRCTGIPAAVPVPRKAGWRNAVRIRPVKIRCGKSAEHKPDGGRSQHLFRGGSGHGHRGTQQCFKP